MVPRRRPHDGRPDLCLIFSTKVDEAVQTTDPGSWLHVTLFLNKSAKYSANFTRTAGLGLLFGQRYRAPRTQQTGRRRR